MANSVASIVPAANLGSAEPPSNDENATETADETTQSIEVVLNSLPKHPLQHTWTLWYFEKSNNKNASWEECQKDVTSFDTVEDFWSIYLHLKPASELNQGCDYSLFKKGIRPMWEDLQNKQGGRWVISVDKKRNSNTTTNTDKMWLEIMLCLIGETFEHSDEVNGAVCNIRGKMDKIAVWTKDAHNAKACNEIGRLVKTRLNLDPQMKIMYETHSNTMVKSGSTTRPTYSV